MADLMRNRKVEHMTQQIELTDQMGVTLIDYMGSDESAVHAARVSIVGARAETEEGERKGLLSFLMSNRHSSPFEHFTATFLLEVPIFVTREVHRHRTFSYNEWSGRYATLQPKFYAPAFERPLKQLGKPGAYTFTAGSKDDHISTLKELRFSYQTAWNGYEHLLDTGIAKEVARDLLPVGIYTSFYMTGNLRNWLNFLSLRTAGDALYEIRETAFKVEQELHKLSPTILNLWDENGRHQL